MNLQEFAADVHYAGGACAGADYTAQGMAPPVQCTSNAACDPSVQPPNAINPGLAQACNTDAFAFSAAVAQNKANDIYNGGAPDDASIQPDTGTGVCFPTAAYPSLGSFQK